MKFTAYIRWQWYDGIETVVASSKADGEKAIRDKYPDAGSIHLVGPGEKHPPVDYLRN